MFKFAKYLSYFFTVKNIYEKPDEMISEAVILYIQTFFIYSLLVLGLLSVGVLFLAYSFDLLFLKVLGYFLVFLCLIDLTVFIVVKRMIRRSFMNFKNKLQKYSSEKIVSIKSEQQSMPGTIHSISPKK